MLPTTINKWDQALLLMLNQWNHPATDIFFELVTDSFFWTPLYILLIFLIRKALGWRGLIFFALTIVGSDQISATWLKPFFARYRPCCLMPQIHLVGSYEGRYGFPSSHAANTYAFAMLFWRFFKNRYRFSSLFFSWATIVSYGRIYGGVHYPLDVFLGAILGCCIGLLMHQIYAKNSLFQRRKVRKEWRQL